LPPPPPDPTPVGGGIGILIAAGLIYAGKKLYKDKKI